MTSAERVGEPKLETDRNGNRRPREKNTGKEEPNQTEAKNKR